MFTIDLTLKNTPIPLSVQKKDEEAAQAVYQQIVGQMRSDNAELIELTCDKDTSKKVAVLSDQITAVVISQKDGATAAGRVAGFFVGDGAQ